MKIKCPNCQQTYDVEAQFAGREIECPACNTSFVIEAEQEDQPVLFPIRNHSFSIKLVVGLVVFIGVSSIAVFGFMWKKSHVKKAAEEKWIEGSLNANPLKNYYANKAEPKEILVTDPKTTSKEMLRSQMMDLVKNLSKPENKHVINMLRQQELAERTDKIKEKRQPYCKAELIQIPGLIGASFKKYDKAIALGLLTKEGSRVKPTPKGKQLNRKYDYYYYPDKIVNVCTPTYNQRSKSIECLVKYDAKLVGVPAYFLDHAEALKPFIRFRDYTLNIAKLKRSEQLSIVFTWDQRRQEWILKDGNAVYDYQPGMDFSLPDVEIKFAEPEAKPAVVAEAISPDVVTTSDSAEPADPDLSDNDKDGFPAYCELMEGTDPNDPKSHPELAKRLYISKFEQVRFPVSFKKLQTNTGANRSDWLIQLWFSRGHKYVKLNDIIYVKGKKYKIIDCVPKKEEKYDKRFKTNITRDRSEVTLQELSNNKKIVLVIGQPTYSPFSKVYLRDCFTKKLYGMSEGETFDMGDSRTGISQYKFAGAKPKGNKVLVINQKIRAFITIGTKSDFEKTSANNEAARLK